MEMGGQRHAPTALPPVKTRYPFYRRLGGPQRQSKRVQKISTLPGFDPCTVQPVASRYTEWTIPAHSLYITCKFDPCTVQPVASRYTDWATRPILCILHAKMIKIFGACPYAVGRQRVDYKLVTY
jgi:hypothetical protein